MRKVFRTVFDRSHCRHRALLFMTLALAVFMPAAVYAGGSGEIVTETADGIDIWQKEFNVTGRKPGTYNIIVNAKDAAGNVGVGGPFNIKVDPMAGLPEARVVYPEHGQVIREDVNIVGVASARYGVKQILLKIDDEEEYQELEGSEYWNYRIPAMDLTEGIHTIYVKAIDSQDIMGPEAQINFILDLVPPEINLIDREIGDLIAGNVVIKGSVYDANEIDSLAISIDGEHFSSLRLSNKRGDDNKYFQFPIRSKKLEDGAVVYYMRATNKTGSSITRPFLFFVNNIPPIIEIISPKLKEDTYGKTQVTGRVYSGVGLTKFFYEWAGEKTDIPLSPGDPFWAVTFPISMASNRSIPFRVTAVDKSGNVTTVTQRFQDSRKYKTPFLAIDYPPQSGGRINLEPDQAIYGHILPGFFPYAIIIEGQIEYVMAQPSFRIPPELIPEGRTTMKIWAMDESDVTGQVFTVRVNKLPRPPDFELVESPITITSPEDYAWFGDSVTVRGSIDGYSGQTLEYRLRWDDTWKPVNVSARGDFTAPVNLEDLPEGPVPMEFRTVREGKADSPRYLPVNKFITLPTIDFLVPAESYGAIHGEVTTTGVVNYFAPLREISCSIDNGLSFEKMEFSAKYNQAMFNGRFDYSFMQNHKQKLIIRAIDRAGNRVQASPEIVFDNSSDFPTIILNSPLEDEIVTGDFNISGLTFDDDGIALVYWRVLSPRNPWDTVAETLARNRNTEFNRFETEQNFSIPVSMGDLTDGENVLEVFTEDIYGTACETIRRVFKVSTVPPVTVVTGPPMDIWNRSNIIVRGTTFDRNGIEKVLVSMDNGISYQRASFVSSQTNPSPWNISLNTKAYADGVYSMLVRTIDKYGVSSFTNGIINIDNSPPEIDLGSPRNGDKIGMVLPMTGQVYDSIGLKSIAVLFVNIENPNVQRSFGLPTEQLVIQQSLDVAAFPDGEYSLKVTLTDQSGNETSVIRNVNLLKARAASEVALINPLPGITHTGPLVVSGKITGAVIPETVTLMLNKKSHADVEVNRYGIFSYELPEDAVSTDDPVVFSASFKTPNGEQIVSFDNSVKIEKSGPVLLIDSHRDGDVITRRPYISGRVFYVLPEEEPTEEEAAEAAAAAAAAPVAGAAKGAPAAAAAAPANGEEAAPLDEKARKAAEKAAAKAAREAEKAAREAEKAAREARKAGPQVRKVEVSLDNGRSYDSTKGSGEQWKFRLETGTLTPGPLPIVVKATFDDDSVAVRRIILTVDTRPPVVHVMGPPENSSHRDAVFTYGSANDDYDMDSVEVSLRPGDKLFYAVPGFIQGLYFDANFLGGLKYMAGLGLTFFDDNVKVQANAAQATPGTRYSGWAFGGKVLANVYTKNLGEWLGPDWEFYTTSVAIGAHFSYFMMEEGEVPLWMGQLLGQWEIIKADMSFFFPKWKYFKTFSLYTEPGIWFAPSDVTTSQAWRTKFTIAFGGRISLF